MLLALLLMAVVDVTWNPQSDVDSFEVYVKSGSRKEVIIPAVTTSVTVSVDLQQKTKIKVRAVNKAGRSAWSREVTINSKEICIPNDSAS